MHMYTMTGMEKVYELMGIDIYFTWLVKSVCYVAVSGIYMYKHGKYLNISHQVLITGKLQVNIYTNISVPTSAERSSSKLPRHVQF